MDIRSLSIGQVRDGLLARRFSAVELAQEALRFAEVQNPATSAYLRLSPERALSAAARVDQKIARGDDPGPLAGVPVAVKDVILTKGVRTTCGSKLLAEYMPPYRCHGDHQAGGGRRRDAGQDQLRRVRHGIVQRELGVRAGAQSGGARTACRADRAADRRRWWRRGRRCVALGSDTGGSIRQPASFCGVVGVTPTYGRVSRYGLVAFASSLDHIGPFARTVNDAAVLLEAIAGRDPMDATRPFAPVPDYTAHAGRERRRAEDRPAARVFRRA